MKRQISPLLLILPLLFCQAVPSHARTRHPMRAPHLLIVSSLIGYVEPCGCTVDLHLGGIDRIVTAVRRADDGANRGYCIGPDFFEKKSINTSKHRKSERASWREVFVKLESMRWR